MTRFVIPDGVHTERAADGRLVLLNGNTGHWHALNRTGADIYEELVRASDLDHIVDRLAQRYHAVPENRIRDDVKRVTADLVRQGLLRPVEPGHVRRHGAVLMAAPGASATEPRRRRVLTVVAFVLALVLLRLPFRMTTSVLRVLKRRLADRDATVPEAHYHLVTVRHVTRYYPGRVSCLESSLTVVLAAALLRQRIDWCFGFATDPQRFHAWIEVAGEPVTERTDEPIPGTYQRVVRV